MVLVGSSAPNVQVLAASLLPADCRVTVGVVDTVEVVDTLEVIGIWAIAAGGGICEIAAVS